MEAEKVALAVAGIFVLLNLLNGAKPFVFDAALPVMQQADAGDSCVVVKDGCHGKRYAVKSEHVSTFYWFRPREPVCTEVLMPIDALDYMAVNTGENCVLDVNVSSSCQEMDSGFCEAQRRLIDNFYR